MSTHKSRVWVLSIRTHWRGEQSKTEYLNLTRETEREKSQTEGKHNLCSRIITHTHIQYASESEKKYTLNNRIFYRSLSEKKNCDSEE